MTKDKQVSSIDAEIAVLSILFNNPDLVYNIDGLRWFMFSSLPHQNIFSEIENQVETQTPLDIGLFIAKAKSSDGLAKIGGDGYIESIVEQHYNPDTFDEYKNIIIGSYKARSIISVASQIKPSTVNVENVDDVIYQVKSSLDNLMESRGGSHTVRIGDLSKSIYNEIISRQSNAGIKGVSWGIPELDRATGGKCPGELIIIGGRPGQGKSALIINSILAEARAGIASLMFQREMRTQEVAERFLSLMTEIPITNIRLGILTEAQVKKIYEALKEFKTLPIYIDTSYRSTDTRYIESTLTRYKRLYDIKTVYLDYIQILTDRDENQTHELGKYSRLFKILANELGICSIVCSQLNRSVEMRENKRPILSDLRQSGNLEEDADIVIGLYRDAYYNKETKYKGLMESIILKYRSGPTGTISLKFNEETNKIDGA